MEASSGISSEISWRDFEKLDIRAGTIRSARLNEKARKPAYVLEIDFGPGIGMKTSSAQIVEAYQAEALAGRQILAVVNFPPKTVAGVVSEVLVLGVVQHGAPTILIGPERPVENGARLL